MAGNEDLISFESNTPPRSSKDEELITLSSGISSRSNMSGSVPDSISDDEPSESLTSEQRRGKGTKQVRFSVEESMNHEKNWESVSEDDDVLASRGPMIEKGKSILRDMPGNPEPPHDVGSSWRSQDEENIVRDIDYTVSLLSEAEELLWSVPTKTYSRKQLLASAQTVIRRAERTVSATRRSIGHGSDLETSEPDENYESGDEYSEQSATSLHEGQDPDSEDYKSKRDREWDFEERIRDKMMEPDDFDIVYMDVSKLDGYHDAKVGQIIVFRDTQNTNHSQGPHNVQQAQTQNDTCNSVVAVKINSMILLDILEEITKLELPTPLVLQPPYKMLILFWDQIISKLEKLKELHNEELLDLINTRIPESVTSLQEPEDHKDNDRDTLDKPEGPENPANMRYPDNVGDEASTYSESTIVDSEDEAKAVAIDLERSINHLQMLVNLMRDEMGPSFELQQRLAAGSTEQIDFANLWRIFTIGETLIYRHDGHEMACKIFSVTGGCATERSPQAMQKHEVFSGTDSTPSRPEEASASSMDEIGLHYPVALTKHSFGTGQGYQPNSEYSIEDGSFDPFVVDCFFMDYDGFHLGPCYLPVNIPYYAGKKDITSFDVYPLRFHDSEDDILERLRLRGRRFIECTGLRNYDGWTLSNADDVQGQIYVDFATGYRRNGWPSERPESGKLFRHSIASPASSRVIATSEVAWPFRATLSDENLQTMLSGVSIQAMKKDILQFFKLGENLNIPPLTYALMSYAVLGYAFQMRRWYYFDVDYIGDIDTSDAARGSGWEDLVIPIAYREILIALVESHTSGSPKRASRKKKPSLLTQLDLVRGKGHGLIILLHGPPGSGKTSTAETIAAYTKRPLYSITCGDIGSTAQEIEKNMQKHFDLANQWGCVLLLDEADVFLNKRDWHDIDGPLRLLLIRLRVVWLRILEYYSGILFVTTNRIGVIDEAFKSRIHICLRYPSIDLASTRLIWEKLLNRIERDNQERAVKIVFDRDSVLGFAEDHYQKNASRRATWNARQIRNACQTAIALGQNERLRKLKKKGMTEADAEASGKEKYMQVELAVDNLQKIAAIGTEFEMYLANVRGSDANLARNESLRDDDYYANKSRPTKRYDKLPAHLKSQSLLATTTSEMQMGYGEASNTADGSSSESDSDF